MRKQNIAAATAFCGFLMIIALGYLRPRPTFPKWKSGTWQKPPPFPGKKCFSGEWSSQAEEYLTDHVPGRNLFVGINAYMELLAGRQRLKDVWLVDGKLAESYAEVVLIGLRYYLQAISEFVKQEGFDDILVCYRCANFLTDTNLMLLR